MTLNKEMQMRGKFTLRVLTFNWFIYSATVKEEMICAYNLHVFAKVNVLQDYYMESISVYPVLLLFL